jgi:hypothetical protein
VRLTESPMAIEPPRYPLKHSYTECDVCGRRFDMFADGRLCMAPMTHADGSKTLCNGTIRPEGGR